MKRAELNFAQKVWLESLWLGARFFAVLPYWFKYYVVENLLFFILYYCLRYRMKVVNENLRNRSRKRASGSWPSSAAISTGRWPRYSSIRSIWPIWAKKRPARC